MLYKSISILHLSFLVTQCLVLAGRQWARNCGEKAEVYKDGCVHCTRRQIQIHAWLLSKGFDEANVFHILLQFIKPEYGVKTLMEMFALEDADIDEILQGLPLAKRRVLKKHIKQDQKGI